MGHVSATCHGIILQPQPAGRSYARAASTRRQGKIEASAVTEMPATCEQRATAHVSVENQWPTCADGSQSRKATALEMVELAVPADDTCLSRLIEQLLEARAVEQPDDGPSHRREAQQPARHGFWCAPRDGAARTCLERAVHFLLSSTDTLAQRAEGCLGW